MINWKEILDILAIILPAIFWFNQYRERKKIEKYASEKNLKIKEAELIKLKKDLYFDPNERNFKISEKETEIEYFKKVLGKND